MSHAVALPGRPVRLRRWAEFAVLFGGAPIVMIAAFEPTDLFPVLLALTAVAAFLLHRTPDFRWRELVEGGLAAHWRILTGFAAFAAAIAFGLVALVRPEGMLDLPRRLPALWLAIMVFYPFVSALPQELIFRALYFRRYAPLFGDGRVAVAVNALAFGYGHLFYQNWIAITLSFGAGAVIGYLYWRTRSFPLAWTLHAIGGMMVFTSGLGIFFYSGAVN
jgi:membrane protease YdiL (CAAX protease family)